MIAIRTSLARTVTQQPLDPDEIEAMKARAWRELGIVVVKPDELRSEWLARGVTAWANETFGPRSARPAHGGAR